jgi:fructan beta-fructosidase
MAAERPKMRSRAERGNEDTPTIERSMRRLIFLLLPCTALAAPADRPDVVVAAFEADDYAGWTATGTAFGKGPARGTLPGQMHVEGFEGHGLVNSFIGGDDATGTLTSPPFTLNRRHLNFLIGGGKYPGETCLDLLVEGSVVRTATGPNDKPGGSERLDWASWDVAEFEGKEAVLRIVDGRKGGWGHINVDQIVQSDRPRGVVPAARDLVVDARYLHLPVANDAPIRRVRLTTEGRTVDEFDIKLAEHHPDFRVFRDMTRQHGRRLRVETSLPSGSKALDGIEIADDIPDAASLYHEKDRPQFHFTARRGWLNDPNGLVYVDGKYHLYFQHNPYGWDWGNMHWGHAVSPDLVHWTELGEALTPRAYGDWCFSGSAVVDVENTSRFGEGGRPPLVLAYTSTGRGECIAFSNDRGRSWREFADNPVVKHEGRDPRLLWHAPTKRWVMAVYDETGGQRVIAFYTSPDLKAWTFASKIDGFFECPDLFELPVDGVPNRKLWVLYAADGQYVLGQFDGREFRPEGGKHRLWYGNFYAAQTFSDAPGVRRIQIGWAQGITFPGMPFNQQMTVPCDLMLRETSEGVRMCALPSTELATLRSEHHSWRGLEPGVDPLSDLEGDLWEIRAKVEVGGTGRVEIDVRGVPIVYDAAARTLSAGKVTAPLTLGNGSIQLHVLVDRQSVEVFGDWGRVAISLGVPASAGVRPLALKLGPGVRSGSLDVSKWRSSWR